MQVHRSTSFLSTSHSLDIYSLPFNSHVALPNDILRRLQPVGFGAISCKWPGIHERTGDFVSFWVNLGIHSYLDGPFSLCRALETSPDTDVPVSLSMTPEMNPAHEEMPP